MRTGQTLTVFQKLETPPPENLEQTPPRKFGADPPRKFGADTPPVNRITHACENITLAQTSFRPVKIGCKNSTQVFSLCRDSNAI